MGQNESQHRAIGEKSSDDGHDIDDMDGHIRKQDDKALSPTAATDKATAITAAATTTTTSGGIQVLSSSSSGKFMNSAISDVMPLQGSAHTMTSSSSSSSSGSASAHIGMLMSSSIPSNGIAAALVGGGGSLMMSSSSSTISSVSPSITSVNVANILASNPQGGSGANVNINHVNSAALQHPLPSINDSSNNNLFIEHDVTNNNSSGNGSSSVSTGLGAAHLQGSKEDNSADIQNQQPQQIKLSTPQPVSKLSSSSGWVRSFKSSSGSSSKFFFGQSSSTSSSSSFSSSASQLHHHNGNDQQNSSSISSSVVVATNTSTADGQHNSLSVASSTTSPSNTALPVPTIINQQSSTFRRTRGFFHSSVPTAVVDNLKDDDAHQIMPSLTLPTTAKGLSTPQSAANEKTSAKLTKDVSITSPSSNAIASGALAGAVSTTPAPTPTNASDKQKIESNSSQVPLSLAGDNVIIAPSDTKRGSIWKVQSRLLCMLGSSNETARRQWVARVTSSRPTPPSVKYLSKLVMVAWETHGKSIDEFYSEVRLRPLAEKPHCALKTLITCLRLLQQGPHEVLAYSFKYIPIVDYIGTAWAARLNDVSSSASSAGGSNSQTVQNTVGSPVRQATNANDEDFKLRLHLLIARLSAMIVQKQHFHHSYPRFGPRYDLGPESSSKAQGPNNAQFCTDESDEITDNEINMSKKISNVSSEEMSEEDDDDKWESDIQVASRLLTMLGTIDGVIRVALGLKDFSEDPHVNKNETPELVAASKEIAAPEETSPPAEKADTSYSAKSKKSYSRSYTSRKRPPRNHQLVESDDEDVGINPDETNDGMQAVQEMEKGLAKGTSSSMSNDPLLPKSALGAVIPLIEESFNIYRALTSLMLHLIPRKMFERYRYSDILGTSMTSPIAAASATHAALMAASSGVVLDVTEMKLSAFGVDEYLMKPLIVQYEAMFMAMKVYYEAASAQPFVAALDKVPVLPKISPIMEIWSKSDPSIQTNLQQPPKSQASGTITSTTTPPPTAVVQIDASSSAAATSSSSSSSANTNSHSNTKGSSNSDKKPPKSLRLQSTFRDRFLGSAYISSKNALSPELPAEEPEVPNINEKNATSKADILLSLQKEAKVEESQPTRLQLLVSSLSDDDLDEEPLLEADKNRANNMNQLITTTQEVVVEDEAEFDPFPESDEEMNNPDGEDIQNEMVPATTTTATTTTITIAAVNDNNDGVRLLKQETEDANKVFEIEDPLMKQTKTDVNEEGDGDADIEIDDLKNSPEHSINNLKPNETLPRQLSNSSNAPSPNINFPNIAPGSRFGSKKAFSSITNPFASGSSHLGSRHEKSSLESGDSRLGASEGHVLPVANVTDGLNPVPQPKVGPEVALEQCVRSFEISGVLLNSDEIVVGEMIGRGAFAVVYRGWYRGNDVAVKELRLNEWGDSPGAINDFRVEVALMKSMHHPNVLELIGACTKPTLRLVSDFCHRGNLFDLLYNDRKTCEMNGTPSMLNWPMRLHLALDEARGMHFLHTAFPSPLIHRDLKSLNLLITQNWTLKVSDFGLSRFRHLSIQNMMTGQCGTVQWMAPEVMEYGRGYNESADVYSFAINLWELATRRVPYEKMDPVQVAIAVSRGERLKLDSETLDPGCPPLLIELIRSCWAAKSEDRPDFKTIIKKLKHITRKVAPVVINTIKPGAIGASTENVNKDQNNMAI